MSAATVTVKCKCCKQPFEARVADRKRGWGKFCSKSCKAVKQTQNTGSAGPDSRDAYYRREFGGTPQYANNGDYEGFTMSPAELAGGGYGDADWDTPFGDGKW